MKFLHSDKCYTRLDKIWNEEIRKELNISVYDRIEQCKQNSREFLNRVEEKGGLEI